MKTEKLNYQLPSELIAQQPLRVRSNSKLLVLNRSTGEIIASSFNELGDFLTPGDCLVLNDTKVLPARFFAQRQTGAKIEGLFLNENSSCLWNVLLKPASKLKPAETIYLKDKKNNTFCKAELIEKLKAGDCLLKIKKHAKPQTILEKIGSAPLPPYIKRTADQRQAAKDKLHYQTVYARRPGAGAAPTAGLHFTNQLIEKLKDQKVRLAYITLHVSLGTFKPITAENIEQHKIHPEQFTIDEKTAQIINRTKQKAGRIIAVGTTSVRTLETAACNCRIHASNGTTDLFIKPGYKFKIVDAMITNFHLPKSSLLALVAAFAGLENILRAYQHAIEKRYRFYSYGDAMLIL